MKKGLTILMALVITFFTVPFGGITALADEKVYDDIKDGEYEIDIKLLKEGTDQKSAAADFMSEKATLIIKEGKLKLTFYIPNNPAMSFNKFEVEGIEPTVEQIEDQFHYTFNLSELKTKLTSQVSYEVPMINLIHNDVGMDIELLGLSELPKMEEPTDPESPEGNEGENGETEQPETPEENEGENGETEQPESPEDNEGENGETEQPESPEENEGENGETEQPESPEDNEGENEETEKQPEVIEIDNGDYTIEYDALHAEEDKASGMARYLENPASISVGNGKILLTLTINDHKTVTGFQVEKDGNLIEPKDITVHEKENSREVTYELDELLSTVKAQVQYTVGEHSGDQPLRLTFNGDSLVKVEIEDPEDENTPEPELDPENLGEGVYTTDYTFLKSGEDQASSMDNFTKGPAFIKVDKDGNLVVALTLTSADMIKWFKVNDQEVTILQEDGEKQTRTVEFAVNNLTEKQAGNVFVEVPNMYSREHEVDLEFDVNSLEETDASKYPENENVKPVPGIEEPTGENPGDQEEPKTPTTPPVEQSDLSPDKAYEIDYVVNHENGTSVSISNDFFVKPAILLEKDGVKYIQITITNGDLVKDLSNQYGDALLVDTKEDGSIVVQLRMNDDLTDMLIDMHIIVPSGFISGFPGYDEQHKAILVFDADSMKEIDADNYLLAVGSEENKNGPTIKGEQPSETIGEEGPGKPEFGSNDDNGKNEEDIEKPAKNGNPQTGDTTNIWLYSMLLVGSLIPLAIQLRRRFV